MDKVKYVKKKLEQDFNVPAKVADNAVKINVKQVDTEAFSKLTFYNQFSDLSIKRSGAGLVIIITPNTDPF